ncbi:GNAT family N-acetyltransferase [Tabrizicola sp.]|uniref:GNAT family N-acetyltransferase n=1 Tax=Tabrizicola sp. TaxID=2005166 RepID=UPI003F3067C8
MAGYFGTEAQRRLQAQAEENTPYIAATPGACQTGRTMGCDDPDRLGWDVIEGFLQRDSILGFRLIPAAKAQGLASRLADIGYRFDTWDVFLADCATGLAACDAILAGGLPEGLADANMPADPEGEEISKLQQLMGGAGIVPFSGSMLTGACGPATTVSIRDGGSVVAAAHGYMPHNPFSPFHRHAWGGLVTVAEAQRGNGIGSYINARVVASAFRNLGATHVYELVSATNAPSRRMVEACGLRREAGLVCGIAIPVEGARFTR